MTDQKYPGIGGRSHRGGGSRISGSITIKGRVNGQGIGGTVLLHASSRVTSEITYECPSIETGAQFEGHCRSQPYQRRDRSDAG